MARRDRTHGVASISAGDASTLVLLTNGTARAFGQNANAELGDGTRLDRLSPIPISGLSALASVATGVDTSFAVGTNGAIWSWGLHSSTSANGLLGEPVQLNRLSPVPLALGVAEVAAAAAHVLARKADGSLVAWGWNTDGRLGDGTQAERATATYVSLSDVTRAVAGFDHSLALKLDGTVWAWGANASSQLGFGNTTASPTPTAIAGLTGVSTIAAGNGTSFAVIGGTLMGWGNNAQGQLGDGTAITRTTPVAIAGITAVSQVATSPATTANRFTVALKTDGTVWTWGNNTYGQLGSGNTTARTTPAAIAGLTGVSGIAVGDTHVIALKSDGTVWSWGRSNNHQIGHNSTANRTTPFQLPTLSGCIAVAAGTGHSLALKSNGTLYAWGLNADGQLGDGTITRRNTPVVVTGFTGATHVSAAGNYSLVRRVDGSLLRFGRHHSGDALALNLPGKFRPWPETVPGLHLGQTAPTVSLTAATATVPMGSSVLLSAAITDPDGPPGSVDFLHDGYLAGTSPTSASTGLWLPPTWGTFSLTAQATDGAGGLSPASGPVTLTVPFDSDADGQGDWWELQQFGSLSPNATSDADSDGTPDFAEFAAGSLWNVFDSDGDGLGDGAESAAARDPLSNDNPARTVPAAATGLLIFTPAPCLLP
jgi:alpha-tubulin suppressor-like RCC1 family protein